jgi:lipopolysaccharide transport system ATP-binding protein
MSDAIISVEGLGKKYRLSHQGERQRYVALRDVIAEKAKRLFRRNSLSASNGERAGGEVSKFSQPTSDHRPPTSGIEDFWALRDVSFEVKRGEVVGIIGRNGAGKSTLLKILSRITEPSEGRVTLRGRVASLLEVGTGFHPELTGRENIFLNGAILGMSRAEIRKKFDEIVAFAEVEKFLDTPVKRYSSGMYVRLAFAVAAHLEPEILIVDEVLAVGDTEFQKKCLGKMQDVAKGGRTVLFVSHNMDAVIRLCSSAIIINKGHKEFVGSTEQATKKYLANFSQIGQPGVWLDLTSCKRRAGGQSAFFKAATYQGLSNSTNFWPQSAEAILFKLLILSDDKRPVSSLAVTIHSLAATKLVNADSLLTGQSVHLQKGENEIHLKIQNLYLKPGKYTIGLWLANGVNDIFDYTDSAFEIDVIGKNNRLGSEIIHDGVVVCDFSIHQPISNNV